jgi:DNA-binding Xre family transcriptional regulator
MQKIYYDINRQLSEWISFSKSNRDFALNHNIDEKSVRRILDNEYKITIGTLLKICEARNLHLSEFFKNLESFKK